MGMKMISGGFLTTVQDAGRYGYQETGMAVSGVMDRRSQIMADILVGNDWNEAVLEITMMGPSIEFTEDNLIAITGGDLGASMNGKPVPLYEAVLVHAGDNLSFRGIHSGSRAYLAVAGGMEIPVVMGSRSTNLKSKVGGFEGRKLGAGDEIGFREPKTNLRNLYKRKTEPENWNIREITLRVVMGPQDDCFTEAGIDTFLGNGFTISNEYDRMGCRMSGPVIEHKNGGDIITDGISFGAVQVPTHGNPIVMMADHQTTGGYTKIANVISVDLPLLAQCRPGSVVHFKKVSIEEAQTLYCEEKARMKELEEAFNQEPAPVSELFAAAFTAASDALQNSYDSCGTYKVTVEGQEFVIELSKETKKFR